MMDTANEELAHRSNELDTLRKELAEVKVALEIHKVAERYIEEVQEKHNALKSERDRYRDAWEKANEHMSDAWALSIDYDGFGYNGEALRGLIDDIVHHMNLGRKVMNTALEASSCGCKNGRRGPKCHDYHEGGQR